MTSELLLLYLASVAGTMVVLLMTALVYFRWSGRAAECRQERDELRAVEEQFDTLIAKLPDAVRWADLSDKVADLEQRLAELRDYELGASQTIAEAQRLEQQIEEHKQELLKLEAERQQQEQVRAHVDSLRQEIPQLEQTHRELKNEAEAAKHQRDSLLQEVESLETRRDQKQGELDTLTRKIQESASQQAEKEARIAALTEQEKSGKQQAEKMEKQVAELEKRRDGLDAEVRELDSKRRSMNDEVRSLENRIDDLNRQIDHLHLQGGSDPEDASREIWAPVISSNGFAKPREESEEAAVRRVQDHLKDCGLQFPDRVVYALHTCFKITDMSPLVVLGGISGTGKSELPRRYAEAMGMHFLPVAVQPRWDSPQDMFGFFNYLEGRYRPTELTRALVQMDPIGVGKNRGWRKGAGYEDLANHMLVVLMDEMNLARVEYYFSELLSKLETRRGIDPDDDQQRQKAEITLEMGKGGEDGQSNLMRLFVYTNVLFVGTMNEDESTQTLSDKVIDRANLLRFGKPDRLFTGTNDGHPDITAPVLEFNQWSDWIRTEDDLGTDADTIHERFERLNDIMARVGRPFAHRMFRAMRAYAANYPDFVGDRVNSAVADQVEQRILPRLRGLDIADHNVSGALDDLGQFIQDLGDTTLRKAFDEARDTRHHQFNWQGVDRTVKDTLTGTA